MNSSSSISFQVIDQHDESPARFAQLTVKADLDVATYVRVSFVIRGFDGSLQATCPVLDSPGRIARRLSSFDTLGRCGAMAFCFARLSPRAPIYWYFIMVVIIWLRAIIVMFATRPITIVMKILLLRTFTLSGFG